MGGELSIPRGCLKRAGFGMLFCVCDFVSKERSGRAINIDNQLDTMLLDIFVVSEKEVKSSSLIMDKTVNYRKLKVDPGGRELVLIKRMLDLTWRVPFFREDVKGVFLFCRRLLASKDSCWQEHAEVAFG